MSSLLTGWQRWRRVLGMPRARRALAAQAACALLLATWHVRRWPFARLAAGLGKVGHEGVTTVVSHQLDVARQVRWAIDAWCRHWPRRPTCLMQAVTAQRLLARRGVGSTLYFGVQASGSAPAGKSLAAHAWLRVGPLLVTGWQEATQFKVVASYWLDAED